MRTQQKRRIFRCGASHVWNGPIIALHKYGGKGAYPHSIPASAAALLHGYSTSCNSLSHLTNNLAIEPLSYCLLVRRFCGLLITADLVICSGKAFETRMTHELCCLGELLRADGDEFRFHPLGICLDFHVDFAPCYLLFFRPPGDDPPQSLVPVWYRKHLSLRCLLLFNCKYILR